MKKLLSALVFFVALQTFALAQGLLPAPSLWENQRGSFLQIDSVDPLFGTVLGRFNNLAQGFQCRNTWYPASGQVFFSRISFTVNFTQCNTVTVWNGQVNGAVIPTTWVLTYPGGTLTGADTFRRVR